MTSSTLTSSALTQQPATVRKTLPNGLTIIAVENPVADIVSSRIFLRTGQLYETPETAGLFDLLTAVLTKGTLQKSALEIAEVVESIGASLGADVSSDYGIVSLKTVSADFETVFALAAEVIRQPSFPEAEVELERRLILQGLKSMKEQPFSMAYNHLREALYAGHPYGLSYAQTEQCLKKFTRDDLQQTHRSYFRPDNVVITIVGRISPSLAVKLVERFFGDWSAPQTPLMPLPLSTLPDRSRADKLPMISGEPSARTLVTAQETNQAFIVLGYLADSVTGPDYGALKLISTYLGNGLSSRLFVELREKQGLAYDVSAFYPTRLGPSHFIAYIGTAPENLPVALAGLQQEVERLKTTLLTPEELQVAKNKILGQYALGKQTNGQIAQTLGWYEILGLGMEFDEAFPSAIAAVSAQSVQAAARRCFAEPYLSVLGPEAVVAPLRPQ